MKYLVFLMLMVVLIASCVSEPPRRLSLDDINEQKEKADGGLNFLVTIGCIGIAIAVGIAIANMGNGLKAILIGVICGAGTLTGLAVMLQHYSKQVGLIMMIGFIIVGLMVFTSLFINKGFLTLPFVKRKV